MPYNNLQPHLYGMRGEPGWRLAGRRLDEIAHGIASPVTSRRGLTARLNYLARHKGGDQALRAAGVTVTARTLRRWQTGKAGPSRANRDRVDAAYLALRRRNVAEYLIRRLNNRGRGTRVEIHPHDQSQVQGARRRGNVTTHRSVNVRHWEGIVESWAEGDEAELAAEWQDAVLEDLGSDWGGYEYCSGIGFAA
ncbi:hypothetical protein [Phaeacidiphilus oryzae]|jgi:hypothetical protein|uniref:hypothetical protein n=1 Tax=Phaeacidiphilus oryzae TaxID=348818 RepID=UPI0005681143|nr:hypothetical protein [Phaeacidiphilus oryzae]